MANKSDSDFLGEFTKKEGNKNNFGMKFFDRKTNYLYFKYIHS